MFNVSLLGVVKASDVPPLVHVVRAWDNAATEGGGAYTVGVKIGFDAMEKPYILDVKREQVNTAGRERLQLDTAREDGKLVLVHAPQDPASAGKDVAFLFEQMMSREGFQVTTTPVTGTKTLRAHNLSLAVNRGEVSLVEADWNKDFKNELRYFPVSTHKDQVDAGSDGYNYLSKLIHHGLVIKGYDPETQLVGWSRFVKRIGAQIPKHWDMSVACHLEADASRQSGWAIVAHAAENAHLGEAVFIVAAARRAVRDPTEILSEIRRALNHFCEGGENQPDALWFSQESASHASVAFEKMGLFTQVWDVDDLAGLPETNWYFQKQPHAPHPFYDRTGVARAYLLVEDEQRDVPKDDKGLLSMRQELISWSYNEKEVPQPYGGVTLNCVRRLLRNFALRATPYTVDEAREEKLPDHLKRDAVDAALGTRKFVELHTARMYAQAQIKIREERARKEQEEAWSRFQPRLPQHSKYRVKNRRG